LGHATLKETTMSNIIFRGFIVIGLVVVGLTQNAWGQLYFTENGGLGNDESIYKCALWGGTITLLHPGWGPSDPWGGNSSTHVGDITLDETEDMIYWVTTDLNGEDHIARALSDGSGTPEIVVSAGTRIGRITVNPAGNKIFWTEPDNGRIMRSSLTGGSITVLYETSFGGPLTIENPEAIAIDTVNNRVYWSDDAGIRKAPIAGGGTVTTINSTVGVTEIELDVADSKLYFTTTGGVYRTTLSGTSQTLLYSADLGSVAITAFGLNLNTARVYWCEDGDILRAPISGGGSITTIQTTAGDFGGLYVMP
jgi:hypothetical protein